MGKRRPVPCSIALRNYNILMGAVDAFNRELAATHMQLGRCKQRWQRSCFLGWLLPAVGVVNTRTAFCEVFKLAWGADALARFKKSRGIATTSFPKWFQLELGEALLREGMERSTHEHDGAEPHFKPMRGKRHWKRPLTLPCPTGTYAEHRDARVDLREKPRAIPIEKNRNGHPVAWLGGGNEEHGGKGRCKLCCIRLHRAGQPTAGATHSRTACTECEVILCKYCWHQWCHEDGGHAPQHIDAPPDPEWHGPPSITTPKRQRASSEQRVDRHKRRRPPSPDAPPVRPRQAARAPSRLQESRKEKAEKKKQKKAQTAKARGANPCNKQARKKRRKR